MTTTTPDVVVLGGVSGGLSFVPQSTPLLRLNYYDGKFLRADDLTLEQRAHRAYVQHSNRAGGPGVVYGFDVSHANPGQLTVSDGLAIDPMGRLLLLPHAIEAPIATLVDAARQQKAATPASSAAGGSFAPCESVTSAPAAVPAVASVDLHLVCVAHAEALCGHEEVFGRLCDEACVTATDRPYRHEGVVVLLVPLVLHNPLPVSSAVQLADVHLRSRVASAYFADEWDGGGSLLSPTGLLSPAWCAGAPALLGELVPLAVLGWKATTITLLDMWTARRERMDTPPRRYWQGRMEMRPWPVFLAQVLQFQCQLRTALSAKPGGGGGDDNVDPCAEERALLDTSTSLVETFLKELSGLQPVDEVDGTLIAPFIDTTLVEGWKKQVLSLLTGKKTTTTPARVLVDGGIVELPAAGYLPVDSKSTRSLQSQVQDLMGPGVDLRFCAVRRDQIAHELERAQHMNRISLLRGIDGAAAREEVDILVPDGEVATVKAPPDLSFALDFALGLPTTTSLTTALAASDLLSLGNDELAAAGRRMLDSLNRAAVTDPKLAAIRGAARLELGQLKQGGDDRSITLRMAAAGPVGKAGARLIRTILAVPDSDLAAVETRIARVFDDTSGGDAGDAGDAGATGTPATVDASVAENAAMIRSVHTTFDRNRAPSAAVLNFGEDPATQVAAVWSTFWAATNPFELMQGQSTAFTLTLDLFVPARRSPLLEARLDGRLDVEKASRPMGGDMRVVQARGFVEMEARNVPNAPRVRQAFDVPLVLLRGRQQGKDVLAIRVNDDEVVAAALGTWGGSPFVFTGSLGEPGDDLRGDPLAVPLKRFISTTAMQDPTLAQPDNVHRKTAVDALTILQGARPFDPSFFETAVRQLFPATEADRVEIQPTTDWVLFRRRRREECADTVQPKLDLVDVVTWTASSPEREEALRWAKLLQSGQGGQVPWLRVGTVQYEAEDTELRSPASALRNDYRMQNGGPDLIFAGYAENGSGPAVAIGRTEAAVDALVPDAALAADGSVATVDDPPADQLEDGTVASIFFVSHRPEERQPVRECVDVFVADLRSLDAATAKTVETHIRHGNAAGVDAASHAVHHVVTVEFVDGQLDEADAQRLAEARDEIVPSTVTVDLDVKGVGWMPQEWSDEQHITGEARIMAVFDRLDVQGQAQEASFEPGDRCPLRAYVIVAINRD